MSSQRDATWRYSLPPGVDRDHLKELCRKQLQNFRVLLAAVEAHPGFRREWRAATPIPLSQEMTFVSSSDVLLPPPLHPNPLAAHHPFCPLLLPVLTTILFNKVSLHLAVGGGCFGAPHLVVFQVACDFNNL